MLLYFLYNHENDEQQVSIFNFDILCLTFKIQN